MTHKKEPISCSGQCVCTETIELSTAVLKDLTQKDKPLESLLKPKDE